MSDINEKIISEFLELMKRVNAIEQTQHGLKEKHDTVLDKTTRMLQGFQDSLTEALKKQNDLVQDTNDNLAKQVNAALENISARSSGIVKSHIKSIIDLDKIAGIDERFCKLEEKTGKIVNSIAVFQRAINQFRNMELEKITLKDLQVDYQKEILAKPIKDMEFTVRTTNCLLAEEIFTLGELINRSPQDLMRVTNLGKKSLSEIRVVLSHYNLVLRNE